eukprot:symbB.v1.2.020846.t1/scaffold1711.1/size185425/9
MHISSLYRETQVDAHGMGWETKSSHSWSSMVTQVDNYIKSLNWGAKTDLRSKAVLQCLCDFQGSTHHFFGQRQRQSGGGFCQIHSHSLWRPTFLWRLPGCEGVLHQLR